MSKEKSKKEDEFPSEDEIRGLTTKALKLICNKYSINSSGNKETLIERLVEHIRKLDALKGAEEQAKAEAKEEKAAGKPKKKSREEPEEKAPEEDKKKAPEEPEPTGEPDAGDGNGEMEQDPAQQYSCSLCNSKLAGDEDTCPGCGVTFGGNVAALIDHDWDVYEDIPTPEEVRAMSKKELKNLCSMLGFEQKMSEDEMRKLILELIEEEEGQRKEPDTAQQDSGSFDPRRAIEETNYIRDSLHKYTEALDLYNRIIDWHLQHNHTQELEDALLQKGICLQYMNEFSKARECYMLAQEVNPKNPEIKALLMGVNALDKFYENKEQKNILGIDATSLKDRIANMLDDGKGKGKQVVSDEYSPGFKETQEKRVELEMKPAPKTAEEPEPDYTLPEEEGPGKDDEILKNMDGMSNRLERLKKLKDSIDLGDMEMRAPAAAGIQIDNRVAKATPIEEPDAADVPTPPELDAEIVEVSEAEKDAEVVEEHVEPVAEVISPEVLKDEGEVEGEIIGEEDKEPGEPVVEGEIIAEEVEAEVEEVPAPVKDIPAQEKIVPTGNQGLDDLMNGGFPAPSNILISAPPFVGKEMILFEFIKKNLEKGKPSVIVTTGDPIMVIRSRMNLVMSGFQEYESKEMVTWVDPRSDTTKKKYGEKKTRGPEDHAIILGALEDVTARYKDKNGGFSLVFVSLTPVISYRDPKEIKDFLHSVTARVEEAGQVGLYSIDSDMHDEAELELMELSMSGIIDIKENQNARSKKDKNLLMVRKMPHTKQSRWIPFTTDDTTYRIG